MFWKVWAWSVTLTEGQCSLGHWICLIGLHLGIKYEVCGWNSICDVANCFPFFTHFEENLTLTCEFLANFWTFDLDLSRITVISIINQVALWYQVWSLWGKQVMRYKYKYQNKNLPDDTERDENIVTKFQCPLNR